MDSLNRRPYLRSSVRTLFRTLRSFWLCYFFWPFHKKKRMRITVSKYVREEPLPGERERVREREQVVTHLVTHKVTQQHIKQMSLRYLLAP